MLQPQQLDYDKGLRDFAEKSFRKKLPAFIDFAMQNQTVLSLLKHLKRRATGSIDTAYQYGYGVWRYHLWLNRQPDAILSDCWGPDGDPLPKMLSKHVQLVDDFVGYMLERGGSPGYVADCAKGVKRLYAVNGLKLDLPRYPRTVLYPNRAPTPEELGRVLAVADLSERVVVTVLALGGFRVGTLCQLTYSHVREDLERGIVPVLVRVEPSITKGHYGGYWSFLGPEAVEYLKAYLDERQHGTDKVPPEILRDDSPLVRDSRCAKAVRPVTPGAVWWIVNGLYRRAGLIRDCEGRRDHKRGRTCEQCGWPEKVKRRHDLRPHSLRYYFRTQLTSAGVNPEYAEFMMGHKGPLYNDIRSKGIEFLRNIYRASSLSIRQKTKASRADMLKELVRGFGYDPDRVLIKEAISEPHRIVVSGTDVQEWEIKMLTATLKQAVMKEMRAVKSGIFESSLESPPGYLLQRSIFSLFGLPTTMCLLHLRQPWRGMSPLPCRRAFSPQFLSTRSKAGSTE